MYGGYVLVTSSIPYVDRPTVSKCKCKTKRKTGTNKKKWPNARCHPDGRLEGARKNHEKPAITASVQDENRNAHRSNTFAQRYCYTIYCAAGITTIAHTHEVPNTDPAQCSLS